MSQFQPGGQPAHDPYAAPAQPSAAYQAPHSSAGQAQYAVAAPPSKILSILSLVAGIVSIIGGSWTFLIPVAGIVLGFIGLNKEPHAKPLAVWGIILSALSILLVIIAIVASAFLGIGLFGLIAESANQY